MKTLALCGPSEDLSKIASCKFHSKISILQKIDIDLKFSKKRNFNIVTPCCGRSNKDGKFVHYENLPYQYGYCHSCGISTIPKNIYIDERGDEYIWNVIQRKYEKWDGTILMHDSQILYQNDLQKGLQNGLQIEQQYISEEQIWKHYRITPENNLLKYLRQTYGNEKTDAAKELYALGSTIDGGIVFWQINHNLLVQKAKVCFYDKNGRRSNRFRVPYKNEDGYFSCLFGQHLISDKLKGRQILVLVESEKTAIVGHILLPTYSWLAYGGMNGLNPKKLTCLIGHKVLVIPDMSTNATNITFEKVAILLQMGVQAKVWDMTNGISDDRLKCEDIYNIDLEDVFRGLRP